jgi:hypothetical protein
VKVRKELYCMPGTGQQHKEEQETIKRLESKIKTNDQRSKTNDQRSKNRKVEWL